MRSRKPAAMGGPDLDGPIGSAPPLTMVAAVVVFIVAATAFLMRGSPFSGDEPLYGLRSRSFAWREAPWFEWPSYRAPGLPLLAAPFVSLPEPLLRAMIVAFAAASVLLVYRLGMTFFGSPAGLWAAAVFAATPGLLASSVYFFPDVPGMFLVLVAVMSLVRYLLGMGSHWWLLLMSTSVLVAGVVRFSIGIVAIAALVALLVSVPSLWSSCRGRTLVTGALLFVVTAAGTFLPAAGASDGLSPWTANRELVSQNAAPLSRRLVTLAESATTAFGFSRQASLGAIAGAVFLVLCAAGLLMGMRGTLLRRDRLVLFPITWFALTLGFYLIALDHFEIRYLVPLFVPVAMVAGYGLSAISSQLAKQWSAVFLATMLVTGLLFGTYLITDHLRADDAEDLAVRRVGEFIASADHDCVLTFGSTGGKAWLLPWYSRCHAGPGVGADVYVAIWRDESTPAARPRDDALFVHSEAFTVTKEGRTEHRAIDLYQVGDRRGVVAPP